MRWLPRLIFWGASGIPREQGARHKSSIKVTTILTKVFFLGLRYGNTLVTELALRSFLRGECLVCIHG